MTPIRAVVALGLVALYAMCWGIQAVWLQQGMAQLRAELGPAWADGGASLSGTPWAPRLVVRNPSFTLRLPAGPLAWQAREVVLDAGLFGATLHVQPDGQRILAPGGVTSIASKDVRVVPGQGGSLAAERLSLGGGAVVVEGLAITGHAGTLTVMAQSLTAAPAPQMPAEALHVVVAGTGFGPAWADVLRGWQAEGGHTPVFLYHAHWAGEDITGSGTLSWPEALAFDGTIAPVQGRLLDTLVAAGAITAAAARAARAVLDVHAAAKPPAPLQVAWRDGTLVVAGFPLWRAAPD